MCKDSNEYKNRLMDIVNDGMQEKYGDGFITDLWDRISDELLNHIIPDGKIGLFLMMYDAANYCRENDIFFQPGISNEGAMCAFVLDFGAVNPMKPHYRCRCGYYEPAPEVEDGFDLPAKYCPECGNQMIGDGHGIEYYNLNPKKEYCISVTIDYSRKNEILKFLNEKYPRITFANVAFPSENGYFSIEYQYAPVDDTDDLINADGQMCVKEDIAYSKYGALSFREYESPFVYTDLSMQQRFRKNLKDYISNFYVMCGGSNLPVVSFFKFLKLYSTIDIMTTLENLKDEYGNKISDDKIPFCIEGLIDRLVCCGLDKSRVESAVAAKINPDSYAEDIEPGDEYIEACFQSGLLPEYLLDLYKICHCLYLKCTAIIKTMNFLAEDMESSSGNAEFVQEC